MSAATPKRSRSDSSSAPSSTKRAKTQKKPQTRKWFVRVNIDDGKGVEHPVWCARASSREQARDRFLQRIRSDYYGDLFASNEEFLRHLDTPIEDFAPTAMMLQDAARAAVASLEPVMTHKEWIKSEESDLRYV